MTKTERQREGKKNPDNLGDVETETKASKVEQGRMESKKIQVESQ